MKLMLNEKKWYVIYTMPKSERKVQLAIEKMGLEAYLPLCLVIRQWSDRMKRMEMPLFPNYVFVKIENTMLGKLFSINGVVKLVSIQKRPVVIRETEILAIKHLLTRCEDILIEDYFIRGTKVSIRRGQFAGLEGIIVQRSGKKRLLIKIDALNKAFSINITKEMVMRVI